MELRRYFACRRHCGEAFLTRTEREKHEVRHMDKAEHRVEMHKLATDRRKCGLPSWAETIDLSAFWKDEAIPFAEKLPRIVAAIRASKWFKRAEKEDDDNLVMCVENIEDSKDEDEFDFYWDEFYDLADYARVWVKTS